VVLTYDLSTIPTTNISKNLNRCTASDLDANRMIGMVCTASRTRHIPPSPPRKTLVGAQRLVCTPTASRRQHQTHCRVSLRHYSAKYSASPFPSPVHIAILYYSYRRCKSPPPPPDTSSCTTALASHPPPRASPANSDTSPVAAQPSGRRPTHDKTPQRPIVHANSYTTLIIPRDVPIIPGRGIVAR
jgi:hypothetical protein